jgi:hypothetical protein
MATNNLPPPQSAFVQAGSLALSNDGYQFLIGLLNSAATSGSTASVSPNVTAAGTNQATATQLTSQWNDVTTAPAGSGVLLSSYQAGQSQTVVNSSGTAVLVYPPPGSAINALAVNAPFSLSSGSRASFDFISETQIYT